MNNVDLSLSRESISDGLETRIVGLNVLYYPSLTSTMDIARAVVHEGCAEGTVVVAGQQTAGRGRLKREWLTPEGNIALSVILYPASAQLPAMIMLASLAVANSIESVTGIKPGIKWPNDILINLRKVSGILIETDARPHRYGHAMYVVIGIGINVNLRPFEYAGIETTATSLSIETRQSVSRLALIRSLLGEMDRLYNELNQGRSLFELWRHRLITIGRTVTVTTVESVYTGIAESVDRDGALYVRCQDGELKKIIAGDVTLR